jgi:hypothetical protein
MDGRTDGRTDGSKIKGSAGWRGGAGRPPLGKENDATPGLVRRGRAVEEKEEAMAAG